MVDFAAFKKEGFAVVGVSARFSMDAPANTSLRRSPRRLQSLETCESLSLDLAACSAFAGHLFSRLSYRHWREYRWLRCPIILAN